MPVPIFLFLCIAAVIILRGPLGRALADRLAGRVPESDRGDDLRAMRWELEEMRNRVLELEERLDFTERILAEQRRAAEFRPRADRAGEGA